MSQCQERESGMERGDTYGGIHIGVPQWGITQSRGDWELGWPWDWLPRICPPIQWKNSQCQISSYGTGQAQRGPMQYQVGLVTLLAR